MLWGVNFSNSEVKLNNITLAMLQIYCRSKQEHFSLKKITNTIVTFNSDFNSIQEAIQWQI